MNTTISLALGPVVTFPEASADTDPKVAHMRRAFSLVSPDTWGRSDWRDAVSAVLTDADLAAAGVTLRDVCEAVVFMTATAVRLDHSTTMKDLPCYIIRAAGYRAGPAA